MSNVLDPRDQASFDVWRATGANSLAQVIWVYNRPIDIDGVRKFHDNLQRGRLSRCIERSPLPFGRHRWVSPDRSPEIEIVASPRPREEFDVWLNEQVLTPLDFEHGPGWHLAVLPFTDGGAGVSLVISHCVTDGLGLCLALADAAIGRDDPISWPPAGSRRRWKALREDARQTARDIPAIGRAVVTAARSARRSRGGGGSADRMPPLPAGADEHITFPTATIFVDPDEWDARARSLGGTSNALLAGLAARLAQRVGRVAANGSVALRMPVNERVAGDTRANATGGIDITVDPAPATTDLREIRAAIKQALIRHRELHDEERAVLPIVPLVPKRLLMRTVRMALTGASSLGVLDPAAGRADGTEADYCAAKLLYSGVTKATMHRHGGLLALVSGRALGQLFVSAIAYQPDRPNSNDGLRQNFASALNDFSLTGTRL